MTLVEKRQRYVALLHAMQTGVAYEMEIPARQSATSPKHLRVGVNAAMADHGALAKLLLEKGVFTEDEYFDKLIEYMEREVKSYEERLQQHYGSQTKITLM